MCFLKCPFCMGKKEKCLFGPVSSIAMFYSIKYDNANLCGLFSCIGATCTEQYQCGSLQWIFSFVSVWRHQLWSFRCNFKTFPQNETWQVVYRSHVPYALHVYMQNVQKVLPKADFYTFLSIWVLQSGFLVFFFLSPFHLIYFFSLSMKFQMYFRFIMRNNI